MSQGRFAQESSSVIGLIPLRFSADDLVDGRYRVVRFLASGGMGDVYEVEDEAIGVRLALKTLQTDLAGEESQRNRFLREIQLASKVTHPNVCRVFGSGIHRRPDDTVQPYLTMELLAGPTLAERLGAAGRLDPDEVLPIARHLAAGLDAAHAQGIVHRDFKSANVMLVRAADRSDRPSSGPDDAERAVITDFGLARVVGADAQQHFVTVTSDQSLMGTAAFMSPEQVSGGDLTRATDIYAFGTVLFQMLTGQLPFAAEGLLPSALARVQQAPRSLRELRPDVPARWDVVIARCLERDPVDRFHSAGDVIEALEGRRRAVLPSRRRRRRHLALALGGTLLLTAVAAWALWRGDAHRRLTTPPQVGDPVQITSDQSLEIDPSLSPDGGSIVYAADRGGRFELWIRSLQAGARDRRLETAGDQAVQPAWSPDGARIAYVSRDPRGIWWLPAQGGEATRLVDFGSRPAWSPDGTVLAFQTDSRTEVAERSLPALPPSTLWTVPVAGGTLEPTQLTRPGSPPGGHGEPDFAPDGRVVAFSAGDRRRTSIWCIGVGAEGDREPELLTERNRVNLHPRWSADGRFLYWLGSAELLDSRAASYAIWRLPIRRRSDALCETVGDPQLVTRLGVATIRQFDLAPDGASLIYGALNTYSHLWSLPMAGDTAAGDAAALTSGRLRHSRPAFSPDGLRLAYDRWQVGTNLDIWILDLPPGFVSEGFRGMAEPPRQVTVAGEWDSQATWLPDGERFAFFSERDGRRGIWTVHAETGATEMLADIGPDADWARVSPDGRTIAFHSREGGSILDVWLYDIESSHRRRLTEDPEMAAFPIWSPDGRSLALEVRRGGSTQVAWMPIPAADETAKITVLTDDEGESWPYSWSPDGIHIAYAAQRDGFWNLRTVSRLDAGQYALTDDRKLGGYVRYPAWSPAGDRIVYEVSETIGDLWRVELTEP